MADWQWSIQPSLDGTLRMIDQLNCGLLVEDADGTILYANQRILDLSGYEVSELEGKNVETLVPAELHDALMDERLRVLNGDCRSRMGVFRRRDGRTFPVAISPSTSKRADNGELALVTLIIDLGEVETARPLGTQEGGLAAELSVIATKLQLMRFTASVTGENAAIVDHPDLHQLSPRERETLEHLMQGQRVPAIAGTLHISQHTVRNHLKSIYRKLGVSSQSELIQFIHSLATGD